MNKKLLSCCLLQLTLFLCAQTGKVGINTNSPQETLHAKTTFRFEHPSQGAGKILRVYKDGSMKWGNTVPLITTGAFTSSGGFTVSGDLPTNQFYNVNITLNPGKWIVKLSLLISTQSYSTNKDEGYLSETYFSDSSTDGAAQTTDYMLGSSTVISGTMNTPSRYGMIMGSVLIENKSNLPKTYYLQGKTVRYTVGTPTVTLDRFTANYWGENRVYAIPFE